MIVLQFCMQLLIQNCFELKNIDTGFEWGIQRIVIFLVLIVSYIWLDKWLLVVMMPWTLMQWRVRKFQSARRVVLFIISQQLMLCNAVVKYECFLCVSWLLYSGTSAWFVSLTIDFSHAWKELKTFDLQAKFPQIPSFSAFGVYFA